jgi:hypothetical protein
MVEVDTGWRVSIAISRVRHRDSLVDDEIEQDFDVSFVTLFDELETIG